MRYDGQLLSRLDFARLNVLEGRYGQFREAADQCKALLALDKPLPLPAYDQAIKASHLFNLLNARGVISVAERQAYIGRVRELAKGCCEAWMRHNGWDA